MKFRPIHTLYMYLQFSIVKDQELNLESYNIICYVYKIKMHIYLHHQIYNFNNVYKPK